LALTARDILRSGAASGARILENIFLLFHRFGRAIFRQEAGE
jgi:hypothetical protein